METIWTGPAGRVIEKLFTSLVKNYSLDNLIRLQSCWLVSGALCVVSELVFEKLFSNKIS